MIYYLVLKTDEYGNDICTSTIETQSENDNPDYRASSKSENEIALGKMWNGTEWVEITEGEE